MRTSIATVSLGGTPREKLTAVAAAGFEGVEIFENDVLTHDGSPVEIGRMVRDAGLEIVAFQPFRDFEGMPEPRRARAFDCARAKFELMTQLGASLVLVCSNASPASLGGIDRAADDLRALGGIARDFGNEVGFKALAWGRHISDCRAAWEAMRRADHPNVGVILDSWHMLAKGLSPDAMRAIPADRITFVQLADAPKMDMDLLQWSCHFRCLPGQGDLPIKGFMEALAATGYDGWLSHEIFNDRFRMASPRRVAEDGERSLINLLGRTKKGAALPAAPATEGVAFIEFAVSEKDAGGLAIVFRAMGFALTGRHKSKQVQRWTQGQISLIVNCEPDGFARAHYITHGPSAAAIGLWVGDAGVQMDRAEALLAQVFRQKTGPGELAVPAIRGVGGSLIHLVDRKTDLGRVWEVEFERVEPQAPGALTRIDHIAQSVFFEEPPTWRLFYSSIFDLERSPAVDVANPAGLVESEALRSPDRSVQIALNGPSARRTQSNRFIEEYFGAGVQHLAFEAADIFAVAEAMQNAGPAPLPINANYHDDLEARFDLDPALAARLRTLNIFYDENQTGRYFQIYTRVFAERFFFEIVQRDGYAGFGAFNAPIRLAA
jgi:4-hydroxyphenylpyruvate dioxygenase